MDPDGPDPAGSKPADPDPADLRDVVLVGHTGAGKTALVQALVAATGTGSPTSEVGRSASVTVTPVEFAGTRINLVDTPGHPDFVGGLRAGLSTADAAVFVVSAADGLDGATALLWDECAAAGLPRAVVVTHLDRPRADFEESVAVCRRVLGDGVVPLYLPLHDETPAGDDVVVALIGLLSMRLFHYLPAGRQVLDADPEHHRLVETHRADLVETIVQESEDDALLGRYLAGEPVSPDVLSRELERAVARGGCHPVLPVATASGVGIVELLELLVGGFPAPTDRPLPPVTTPDGHPREPLGCDPAGPLVAQVVRTTTDPTAGRLSLLRVFSGILRPESPVGLGRGGAHRTSRPAARPVPVPHRRCVAGDFCVVTGLAQAEVGDTLSDLGAPLLIDPWDLPEPLLPVAIRVAGPPPGADRVDPDHARLAAALARLCADDRTMRTERDGRTGQLVLWATGETQVAVLLAALSELYGAEVTGEPVRLSLQETFAAPGSGWARLPDPVGHLAAGAGSESTQVGVEVEVEPLPPGAGIEFVDRTGGEVPASYVAAAERGARARAGQGLRGGHPLTDVRVTLTAGPRRPTGSDETAVGAAAGLALEDAAAVGLRLLEPVDAVEVTVDDEYLDAVLTDLSVRRGRVTGTEQPGTGRSTVRADVPAASLARYAVELRSIAHGTGVLTRRPAGHEPAPPRPTGAARNGLRRADTIPG
jgi:elongation factor G